ncbi:MAG: GNAT family N-acetyltransferase, partial [Candidatus Competibacteraceae bacterium]|nr:GNAT family N-acetyltransferase [Candidatus Competibacteraceae bacterium]
RARVAVGPPRGPAGQRLAIRPYPRELEETIQLPDGRRLLLRPIRAEDGPWLREGFSRLTPKEIRLRFHYSIRELSPAALARLTQIDYQREMALVLVEEGVDRPAILGAVRLVLEPGGRRAEFAIIVWKALTGLGLGVLLLRRMIDYARSRGVGQIFGTVSRDNTPMLHLAGALGFIQQPSEGEAEQVRVVLDLED